MTEYGKVARKSMFKVNNKGLSIYSKLKLRNNVIYVRFQNIFAFLKGSSFC